MVLLCIGDSITFGYGVLKNERFINLIKEQGIKVINRGINGDTTSGMLSRISGDLERVNSKGPVVVLIMGGINDFLQGRNVDYVYKNIWLMGKEVLQKGFKLIIGIEGAVIVDKAMVNWDSTLNYNEINNKVKQLREFLKASEYTTVDFYEVMGTCNSIFIDDGIHPDKNGHALMAKELLKVLNLDDCKNTP